MEKTLDFKLEKETKGAVRYYEADETGRKIEQMNAIIGTVYVRKHTFEQGIPDKLQITLRY